MLLRIRLVLISFALFSVSLIAQEDIFDIKKSVNVIEPTAAALGTFGTYPVSYSTGLPNISIPLYTIKCGQLEVPIGLNYHGGGITVNQDASWVGLGWSLTYGGSISRQMNGLPDEYEDLENVPDADTILAMMNEDPTDLENNYFQYLSTANQGYSYMPDVYNYNIISESGQFIYDEDLDPFETQFTNNKIYFNGGGAASKNYIITPDGTIFDFSERDYTEVLPLSSGVPEYASTWHLNSIRSSKSSDVIQYSYQDDGAITNESFGYSAGVELSWEGCYSLENPDSQASLIPLQSSLNRQRVETIKPKEINYKSGRVRFVLGNRDDLYCDLNDLILSPDEISEYDALQGTVYLDDFIKELSLHKLDSIIIEEQCGDSSYQELYSIVFDYSYFQSCSTIDHRDNIGIHPNCLRLRLDRVLRTTTDTSIVIADFDYYNAHTLPDKHSFSTDYWGYYNGANNSDPIPDLYSFITSSGLQYKVGSADRSISEDHVDAGSLKTVTYPTKGSTKFNWELNRYGENTPVVKFLDERSIEFEFMEGSELHHDEEYIDPTNEDIFYQSTTIHIGYAQTVILKYNQFRVSEYVDHLNYDEGEISIITTDGTFTAFSSDIFHSTQDFITEAIYLPEGSYNFKITRNCDNIETYALLKYNAFDPEDDQYNYPIGGLRVSSIENYDKDDSLLETRSFTYIDPITGYSSGKLNNSRTKTYLNALETIENNWEIPLCTNRHTLRTMAYSDPIEGLHSNSVTYQHVQEYVTDESGVDLGYTNYEFSTKDDNVVADHLPVISSSWAQGRLLKTSHYSRNGSTYEKQSETQNIYSEDGLLNGEVKGFKLFKHKTITSECASCEPIYLTDFYEPVNYYYRSNWLKLDTTIQTNYHPSSPVQSRTSYNYDNPEHTFPTEITSQNSNGEVTSQVKKYPLDYSNSYDIDGNVLGDEMAEAIHEMKEQNTISQPIENSSSLNNKIVGGFSLKYDLSQSNNHLLPVSTWQLSNEDPLSSFVPSYLLNQTTFQLDDNYEEKAVVDNYDVNGNILQMHTVDNHHTSYLWGYNSSRPIIVAQNIEFTSLANVVDTYLGSSSLDDLLYECFDFIDISGNLDDNKVNTWKSFVDNIQAAFPNGVLAFYTYHPLVGMTSQTDPNGKTTYYEYDDFGRLIRIKDSDGNLVQETNYNYANQ